MIPHSNAQDIQLTLRMSSQFKVSLGCSSDHSTVNQLQKQTVNEE